MSWQAVPPARKIALWDMGFRPFFLFGAWFAVLSVLTWGLYLNGVPIHFSALDPVIWHAHEMIYGFSTAIIAGFILTAIQNWTGIRGPHGNRLKFLVFLWGFGRILLLLVGRVHPVVALIDLLFFPSLAYVLMPYFKDPEVKVERVFFLYFSLFFSGNLMVHLDSLGWVRGVARTGVMLGLHTLLLVVIFIGGRVIPFFTESSVVKSQPRVRKSVEVLSHISAWFFLLANLFNVNGLIATSAFLAALVHLIRLAGWQVPRIRRIPLIWVLHLAYLWIVIGFFLSGLASLHVLAPAIAVHAFTVGGIGLIVLGMIARVSLGHTGRRLHPSFLTGVAFVLLALSAFFRVLIPLFFPSLIHMAYLSSAILWVGAFALFTWVYRPYLIYQRVDGRPG